ncbi:hypothetical protein ASPCADRAFT_212454 [Aspergillus carbonarius ITEM 5010]|uniref:Uncharacterized protein n=1 Tax=Aspergillus carbonarius (strain ITEM 5010) TaxID=602072 RepID=A0A1R3R5T0_ASPC5|nr:hypothetical protein ASPCADRAFT_212454 [Aspergillus carbonarius ITEM 5010]
MGGFQTLIHTRRGTIGSPELYRIRSTKSSMISSELKRQRPYLGVALQCNQCPGCRRDQPSIIPKASDDHSHYQTIMMPYI